MGLLGFMKKIRFLVFLIKVDEMCVEKCIKIVGVTKCVVENEYEENF